MKGELAAEFSSNALPGSVASPALTAEFGAAATSESANLRGNQEFELSQKAHVLVEGGTTSDDRVRRYAELMGTGVQQQGERKDKDERHFRTQLALRSQAELRERLDSMRGDLGRKIDQRISVVEQLLAAAQKALAQAQNEHERLVRIQEQIVQEGYWKLSAEDQEFLEKTAGKDVVEAYKKHDPKLEKARDAKNADPQSKEKSEAFEREADHSRAIGRPVVEEKRVEVEKAGRDVAELQVEKTRLIELQALVASQETNFKVENGRFTDPLLQKAAEKAGLDPEEFDPKNDKHTQALYDELVSFESEIEKTLVRSNVLDKEGVINVGRQNTQPNSFPAVAPPQQ